MRGNSRCLLVFTNLLAHADSSGAVDIHPRSIADEVGLPLDEVRAALLELESIDPESRSHEQDGRRIIRLDGHRDWGWQIVNYVKYRKIKSEDDRREQNRQAQEKWRAKNKQSVIKISNVSRDKPESAQEEAEAEEEGEGIKTKKTRAIAPPVGFTPPDWVNANHWKAWHSCPKRKKATHAQMQMAVDKLDGWRLEGSDYAGALENAAVGGYQGLFLPDKRMPVRSDSIKASPGKHTGFQNLDYKTGINDDGSFS